MTTRAGAWVGSDAAADEFVRVQDLCILGILVEPHQLPRLYFAILLCRVCHLLPHLSPPARALQWSEANAGNNSRGRMT